MIAALSLLESGFALVRINTLYPFVAKYEQFSMIFCCEDICFFGATWLFVINYYETAIDFEHILLSEESYLRTQDSYKKTQARKKKFLWIRWSIFALICVLSILQGTSIFFKS